MIGYGTAMGKVYNDSFTGTCLDRSGYNTITHSMIFFIAHTHRSKRSIHSDSWA
jgi:hypothetical protein